MMVGSWSIKVLRYLLVGNKPDIFDGKVRAHRRNTTKKAQQPFKELKTCTD